MNISILLMGQSFQYQVEQPNGRIVTKHDDLSLYYHTNQTLPVGYNIGNFDTFTLRLTVLSSADQLNAVSLLARQTHALRPLEIQLNH